MKIYINGLLVLALLLVQSCSYLPEELELSEGIKISETNNYIHLQPTDTSSQKTGFFFYPGGLVDPHAYMTSLEGICMAGYEVVILKVAANLAILDGGSSQSLLQSFEGIDQWVIGGHSLGAVVASMDIHASPNDYVGLVLMAGYPTSSSDLSNWDGAVLSLLGEKDALATPQDIEDNKELLPTGVEINQLLNMPTTSTVGQTIYHEIIGGNHAQFGDYGVQQGDGEAMISKSTQHQEMVDYILSFFHTNQW